MFDCLGRPTHRPVDQEKEKRNQVKSFTSVGRVLDFEIDEIMSVSTKGLDDFTYSKGNCDRLRCVALP